MVQNLGTEIPGATAVTPSITYRFRLRCFDFCQFFWHFHPSFNMGVNEPDERWSYSNGGYLVLGYIIEEVSGQTYEAFLQQAIFSPP
jgi:hypothetical protein